MSKAEEVKVPDIGDFDQVDVIEVLIQAGDRVDKEQPLITLESEKSSLEVPSPVAGKVAEVALKVGDKVSEGDLIARIESDAEAEPSAEADRQQPAKNEVGAEGAETEAGGESTEQAAARDRRPPGRAPVGTATHEAGGGAPDDRPPGPRLVVIGAGPGGYTAAFRAADLGLEVTLIERYPSLGGVCLNVGCIPSKALLHAARAITETREMAAHGLAFGEPSIDTGGLRKWKNDVVGRLTGGLSQLAKRRKVEVIHGTARFSGLNSLAVEGADKPTVDFDQAILAMGSRSVRLPFLPDDPRIMYSTQALELEDIPGRLLIIGGGIIGLEMATLYAALGSRVTVVEMTDQLLPGADRDLVAPLRKQLGARLEAIYLGTRVSAVKANPKTLTASFEGEDAPDSERYDRILVAVGRRPNSDVAGLGDIGIEPDQHGRIPVDGRLRTSRSHIFAIGDLVAGPMLAHKASHEGKTAAEVAAGHRSAFDARAIPSICFSDPEIAWAGLTEAEAKSAGIDYGKGSFPWAANGRSLGMAREEGLTKLLFDNHSGRLLGAGVVGPSAGDLISELALAIEMGCVAEDIALTIHPHPTLSETVGMAAEAFAGTLTDLYLPKRR